MRLTRLLVQNYRCIENIELEVDGYTALVGANGAGKSSILYALDWFFNGNTLDASDLTRRNGKQADGKVEVTATFSDLSPRDRGILREYGRGEHAVFRRSWAPGDKATKVVGRALQGPGFGEFHSAPGVAAMRSAYRELQSNLAGLPELSGNFSKSDAEQHLADWEDRPENQSKLVPVEDVDANHMFGIYGTSAIRECVQFILIPAATDMRVQFTEGAKGAALTELLGAMVRDAGNTAKDAWLSKHKDVVSELNKDIESEVAESVRNRSQAINRNLQQIIPDASVSFVPNVPTWTPKNDTAILTEVTIDGITNDVARQGHGVQRSILIATFQALSEPILDGADKPEPGTTSSDAVPPAETEGPTLMVCIEEPEIYQHPIRARAFGRVLGDIADQNGSQIMIATHSPYFVSPRRFQSIRRIRSECGITRLSSTTVARVASHATVDKNQVLKTVEKQLPTRFAEGFFADAVVIVEGDTDRVILETLAERLGSPLDAQGISVLDLGGKGSLRVPYELLSSLDISTYVIADGDADGSSRVTKVKDGEDLATKRAEIDGSHRSATIKLLDWLPVDSTAAKVGNLPYSYGDPSLISTKFTIWRDDLESELEQWSSFVAALTAGGGKLRQKNAIAYRVAVQDADLSDMPPRLKTVVAQICALDY